ncbi:trypsin-like peptidase domain-containing protein [Acinetobacter bereziniae]|uniref:S1 family peptidase n=1 Tax=Acinetobacter bereziniae TaxID=106648 RepID=UPI00190280DA|nr:serine protease [Acinetobacter bereziniae]MBJ8452931.1 trypsin-like peptidase domain-containing protein [Acinetobacter bereziniae]MBJ8457154.1 trypsin-like peptidase domain-containing protein [Acinetobacter bereziniae]
MNFNLSLAERLLYSTVKIIALKQGNIISTGTGFFTTFNQTSESIDPVIITNKHVVNDADQIRFTCHISEENIYKPSGRFLDVSILLHDTLTHHPDPSIDLCAISTGYILQQALDRKIPIFYAPVTMDAIPTDLEWNNFDAIEDITMVGCPNGIYDNVNNSPIIRKGITATSPSNNYNGKNEFMIDMACFPGSSGSPVFLYNPHGYLDKVTNQFFMGKPRLKLLGILYAGPQVTNSGQIILANPTQFTVNSMMHLGYVINSKQLKVLESHWIQEKTN